MTEIQRFKGRAGWFKEPDRNDFHQGSVDQMIVRPTDLVMDVTREGVHYLVRLARTGEAIFQGTWQTQHTPRTRRGSAECTIGSLLAILGSQPRQPQEEGVLEFEGRWTEDGEWWWVGKLEKVEAF